MLACLLSALLIPPFRLYYHLNPHLSMCLVACKSKSVQFFYRRGWMAFGDLAAEFRLSSWTATMALDSSNGLLTDTSGLEGLPTADVREG